MKKGEIEVSSDIAPSMGEEFSIIDKGALGADEYVSGRDSLPFQRVGHLFPKIEVEPPIL